ncbi:histone-lysine N-methyltransferase PRDM9 [Musca domestica]|uniref:Histone-lysine N-methyltransferase PRDM9 n=1 Tax=Musca domestica TaxID=7370 RepID=A0A9J7DGA5_MUSDO|nr:histone-lysine N-methyltransferase PRDM9 [Musca domestica]
MSQSMQAPPPSQQTQAPAMQLVSSQPLPSSSSSLSSVAVATTTSTQPSIPIIRIEKLSRISPGSVSTNPVSDTITSQRLKSKRRPTSNRTAALRISNVVGQFRRSSSRKRRPTTKFLESKVEEAVVVSPSPQAIIDLDEVAAAAAASPSAPPTLASSSSSAGGDTFTTNLSHINITNSFSSTSSATPYNCLNCGRKYQAESTLKRHMRSECNQPKKFICRICNRGFHHNFKLADHYRRLHKNLWKNHSF